eukprot:5562845-Karenia_brevis.AAC.1
MSAWPVEWRQLVEQYMVFESVSDQKSKETKHEHDRALPGAWTCEICGPSSGYFKSEKALMSHQRVKHGRCCAAQRYIGREPVCPVCGMRFASRLRAIAHLSEKRMRGKIKKSCYSILISGVLDPIPTETLEKLDENDRLERLAARRQ